MNKLATCDTSLSEIRASLDDSVSTPSRLPTLLRTLGAAAVFGSAAIFMAQGLHDANGDLRNWIYLLMMVVLGCGGIFSIKTMGDDKGARLFFGLATALAAVQWSQIGALLYGLVAGPGDTGMGIFEVPLASLGVLGVSAAASLLLSLPIAYAGFAVLARPHARPLTGAFTILNLLMIIPIRHMPESLFVILTMAGAYFTLEARLFTRDCRFATREGAAVRALMGLPLVITMARACFYLDDLLSVSIVLTLAAALTQALRLLHRKTPWVNEILTLLFLIFGIGGISGMVTWADQRWLSLGNEFLLFAYTLPLIALLAWASITTSFGSRIYRGLALLATAALTAGAWPQAGPLSFALLCLLGAGILFWGVLEQRKVTALLGGALAAGCSVAMLASSLHQVSVNSWLLLGVVGFACVALSSVIERHGSTWLKLGRNCAREFSAWDRF